MCITAYVKIQNYSYSIKDNQMGNIAKWCHKLKSASKAEPIANWTSSFNNTGKNTNWMLDTGASHHITAHLQNFSLHSEYKGPDDVILADGFGLLITHVGTTQLSSPAHSFSLNNFLCVPFIKQNLISFSQFCKTNNVSIEFWPD